MLAVLSHSTEGCDEKSKKKDQSANSSAGHYTRRTFDTIFVRLDNLLRKRSKAIKETRCLVSALRSQWPRSAVRDLPCTDCSFEMLCSQRHFTFYST